MSPDSPLIIKAQYHYSNTMRNYHLFQKFKQLTNSEFNHLTFILTITKENNFCFTTMFLFIFQDYLN